MINNKECTAMDIRNSAKEIHRLKNCSVIFGSLQIVLMDNYDNDINTTIYKFDDLREITGYLLIYAVSGMKSIGHLFPNLIVIRGMELIDKYSLSIFDVHDLKEIPFRSLIEIQHGNVYIGRCPNLCSLKKINWNGLTKENPQFNVIQKDRKHCTELVCRGCTNFNCWTEFNCQRIYKGHSFNGIKCHEQCLGGCVNVTAAGCFVCKGVSKAGVCLEKCPELIHVQRQRCYTIDECLNLKMIPFNGTQCLMQCPDGYSSYDMENNKLNFSACYPCDNHNCPVICDSREIKFARQSKVYQGCTIISGSLNIRIKENDENVMQMLQKNLGNIEHITGILKIYKSMPLENLLFLSNLKMIHGEHQTLENNCSLIIYENPNLYGLWTIRNKDKLIIKKGSIFINANDNLCLNVIEQFLEYVSYNDKNDYIRTDLNGYGLACNNNLINSVQINNVIVQFISQTFVLIKWNPIRLSKNETSLLQLLGYYVYYIESPSQNITTYKYGENVCSQSLWQDEFISVDKLTIDKNNITNYVFNMTNLNAYTQYAFYIKTLLIFKMEFKDNHQPLIQRLSPILYFTTSSDKPSSVWIKPVTKTDNSITLKWFPVVTEPELITDFKIEVYLQYDNVTFLDQRNYCDYPLVNDDDHDEDDAVDNVVAIDPLLLNENQSTSSEENINDDADNENNNDPNDINNVIINLPPNNNNIVNAINCCTLINNNNNDALPVPSITNKIDLTTEVNLNEHQPNKRELMHSNKCDGNKNNNGFCIKHDNLRIKRNANNNNNNGADFDEFHREIFKLQNFNERTNEKSNWIIRNERSAAAAAGGGSKYIKLKQYLHTLEFPNATRNYTFTKLKPFQTYIFQIFACNPLSCSPYTMLNVRTEGNLTADKIQLKSIVIDEDLGTTVFVLFDEPEMPNGAILTYTIELLRVNTNEKQFYCVTRKRHATNSFKFKLENLQIGFYGVRIQSTSLAGPSAFSDYKFVEIKSMNQRIGIGLTLLIIFLPFIIISIGILIVWYFKVMRRSTTPLWLCWKSSTDRGGDDTNMLIENMMPNATEDFLMEDIDIL